MIPMVFIESQNAFATATSTTAEHDVGTIAWNWNSTFKSWQKLMYVQLHGAVDAAAGSVSTFSDQGFGTVTVDRDGDVLVASTTYFAGVFLGTVAANSYGWVCVGGVADCQTDDAVSAGDPVIVHGTDKECDTMADGEEEFVFGCALEDATTAAPTIAVAIRYWY